MIHLRFGIICSIPRDLTANRNLLLQLGFIKKKMLKELYEKKIYAFFNFPNIFICL